MSKALVPAERVPQLRGYLESKAVIAELAKALPRGLTPQRIVRQTMTLVQKDHKLLGCTDQSILVGLMAAAELGLEMTGPLGHCYLVPRWNKRKKATEAVFQVGWKGLVKLAYQSPALGSLTARSAHANDEFDYSFGTDHSIHHRAARGDRGEATHYYAVAFFASGEKDFEVWTREEVLAHRAKYSPPPADGQDFSAWATAFDAMAVKTVLRKLCSRLSLCPQAQNAAALDEYLEAGIDPDRRGPAGAGTRSQELLAHMDAQAGEDAQDAEVVAAGEGAAAE